MTTSRTRRRRRHWILLRRLQRGRCFYCGEEMDVGAADHTRMSTFDEVVPRARGGRAVLGNQVLACLVCNAAKRDRAPTPDELDRLAALNASLPQRPIDPVVASVLEELEEMHHDEPDDASCGT